MATWERVPDVLWRSTSRGPVVLGPGDAGPVVLGGAGALVWELMDHPMTTDELTDLVSDLITSGRAPDAAEVESVVAQLHERDLVRTTS